MKAIKSWLVSLFLPTQNWCTIGPLTIILVPHDSKCSNKHPRLIHPVKPPKTGESVEYGQRTPYADNPYHNEWLVLSSATWFVQFSLLVNCCHVQRRRSWSSIKISAVELSCAMLPSPREGSYSRHGCSQQEQDEVGSDICSGPMVYMGGGHQ